MNELRGTDQSRVNWSGADLSRADLKGVNFSYADLSGTNLYGADLTGANLDHANLSGANLLCASLCCASLIETDLRGTNLCDVLWDGAYIKAIGLGNKIDEMAHAQQLCRLIDDGLGYLVIPLQYTWELSRKYPTIAQYCSSLPCNVIPALKRIADGKESVFTSPFANL